MAGKKCGYSGHTFNPACQGDRFVAGMGYVRTPPTDDPKRWHCPGCDRVLKVFTHPFSNTYLQFPRHNEEAPK